MFPPHPGKEKAPKQRARPRRPGPRPGQPRGRDEPAVPHLPRRPAPTPFYSAAEPQPAPRRGGGGAAGLAPSPFFLRSPQPRPRRSYPASRLPESPATATVSSRPADSSSLTWFKSSHKTRTASRARPLGAASIAHWLSPRSWARLVGKEPIAIGRPGGGGAREKTIPRLPPPFPLPLPTPGRPPLG